MFTEHPRRASRSSAGADANPLFAELATPTRTAKSARWNFHKYLVARDGSIEP